MSKSAVIFLVILCSALVFVSGGFVLVHYLNNQLGVSSKSDEKTLLERDAAEKTLQKEMEEKREKESKEDRRKAYIAGLDKNQEEEKFDVRVHSEQEEKKLKKVSKFNPMSQGGGRSDAFFLLAIIIVVGWIFYMHFLREELTDEEKKKRKQEKQQPPPPAH